MHVWVHSSDCSTIMQELYKYILVLMHGSDITSMSRGTKLIMHVLERSATWLTCVYEWSMELGHYKGCQTVCCTLIYCTLQRWLEYMSNILPSAVSQRHNICATIGLIPLLLVSGLWALMAQWNAWRLHTAHIVHSHAIYQYADLQIQHIQILFCM